jgi:S-adenosylmethionine-dependent methyltransferase
MSYRPELVVQAYQANAAAEDAAEKGRSLRVEIPREFIKRYLKAGDAVLDAGGGTGINAIMMARRGAQVTLLDITPGILALAEENVRQAGLADQVELVRGDITDLSRFRDGEFSLVVCVGDAVSYVLERRFQALDELVRVAQVGACLVIGCDSKLGFMRLNVAEGHLDEAWAIWERSETECGMGPRTHLYTVEEMTSLLEVRGCDLLEVASTPTFGDTIDLAPYKADASRWKALKALELEVCTRPELLGMGNHLLFVAKKRME